MHSQAPVHLAESLLERLPFVGYVLELEGPSVPLYVSPQMEAVFGIAPEEFDGDPRYWTGLISDEDRSRFLDALQALRTGGGSIDIEYRVDLPSGARVWVHDSAVVDDSRVYGYLLDVTNEKRLEHELARERATLDAFFNESSIGLGISDDEGRYLRINDALARLNGGVPEDFLGQSLADVAPDLAAAVDPLRLSGETGEHVVDLERGQHTVHAHVTYFPFDVDGRTYHGRAVVDMSEQRRAEAAEERYRNLVEQLPLVSYVNEVSPIRRASFISPQIFELTGRTAADFLADKTLGDRLIHPDDQQAILESEQQARRAGTVFEHEYRIVRADGEVRWVLDRMETIAGPDGEPLYEQGFLVDVTQTQETAALLRAVWDGALDAMVIADDDGRYVDANPAACRLFGRSREELIGLQVTDVTEADASRWEEFRAAGTSAAEVVIVRPDGKRREVEGAARANVMAGRHLAVLRDVTERRQLERDLWRAQKLESVGRLAGGVAHDFNNMLTAIRGYAQLLQARVPPGSVERHHATEIDRAADRAAALTAQLLALGRRQTLKARPLDLNRHLEDVRDTLIEVAGPAADLQFELEPALRAVRVDVAMLGQAIVALVGNAAEALEEPGRIVIRTANADVSGRDDLADGRYVVLSVQDEGRGIDETTLEHVFEPFFTTKEVGAGTGLGLASAYGTVRQSGGTISVESELGAGTTFSVFLPEAAADGDGEPRPGNGETMLVIERDPAIRDVVFELLTDAGYRVLTTRTPVEAVRLAERYDGAVDLLLSDLDELREKALAGLLREARPALRTLSLAKPYTPDRLRAAVLEALGFPERGNTLHVSG